jgi:hypothetical protein
MTPDSYAKLLHANTDKVLSFASALSAQQLAYQPQNGWGILQILEHVYLTDRLVHWLVSRPSERLAETAEIVGAERLQDKLVNRRQQRVNAPESLHPKGAIRDINSFNKLFAENRMKLIDSLASGKISVDTRIHRHPMLGDMTITDWLNFVIHHTDRHLQQSHDLLNEIKIE